MRLRIQNIHIEGETGLDIIVVNSEATVEDLLQALQAPADDPRVYKPLLRERYGRCAGCLYNCCKSNDIPLDLIAALSLADSLGLTLKRFAQAYLKLDSSVVFPEFRKRPCPFLSNNLCTVYEARALICRLYICTPMSDRLERLRCAVLLMGEGALRQRLVDLGLGPKSWTEPYLVKSLQDKHKLGLFEELSHLDILIHHNPYLLGKTHATTKLRECCTEELWEELIRVDD